MGALRQWLLGVVLTAFAAGLAREVAPKGREQVWVRLVGGLLLMLAILRPLAGLSGAELALETGSFSRDTQAQTERYRRERQDVLASIIAEKTAAYIWDKAYGLGLQVSVEVTTAAGESGIPLPDTVAITGPYSAALAACIEEGVGIPAEKLIWLEESAWSETKEGG